MIEEIHWISIGRNALPGVIAEGAIPENGRKVTLPFNETDDVFIGCTLLNGQLVPVVAVLNAQTSREVLAWLAAYSTASFPLSQSLRSISSNEKPEIKTAIFFGPIKRMSLKPELVRRSFV